MNDLISIIISIIIMVFSIVSFFCPIGFIGLIIFLICKGKRGIMITIPNNTKTIAGEINIEPLYNKSEKNIVKDIIKEELKRNNYDYKNTISYIENRKFKITLIFSILNFLLLSLVFFHISGIVYFLLVLNIVIYLIFIKKYNIVNYIYKQVKARPDDDISLIISSIINDKVFPNKTKKIIPILISIILPLFIFRTPMMFYEKYEDGYFVRFYTMGLTGNEVIKVPETYKGKKVLGIRGNVFANLINLKEVYLPDGIEIIRGKAFLNDINLKYIELPENLKYLGGSAFKNCKSLTSIEIPESVTEINGNTFEGCTSLKEVVLHDNITSIHGSAFKNCSSLEEIKLPKYITEIRGNTFENCTSLKRIDIPDNVTRIGGHAFYGDSSLEEVSISEKSSLKEIGSSAFRKCNRLYNITMPYNVYVNERAFKESPTLVKRYNEENYSNNVSYIDTTKYKYNSYKYFYVGYKSKIGEYHNDANIYNTAASLTLKEINIVNNLNEYLMEYTDNEETVTFTLNKNTPYKIINSDVAVQITKASIFENKYSTTLSVSVYYN